jgi:hypothetical protein
VVISSVLITACTRAHCSVNIHQREVFDAFDSKRLLQLGDL